MARLSRERWNEISRYLDQALDLEPDGRERWLRKLKNTNPELAQELHTLLGIRDDNVAAKFLERSPLGADIEPAAGQQIGAYTLVSLLGSGGMGSVWLARRSDGHFDAKVAIKILDFRGVERHGGDQVRREAGLLAQQSHANIARLFDAGFGAHGEPYLILEYIEGIRIDEYCDRHELPLEARLEMMLSVVDAVAHAHGRAIVHRDLKPSNILVTAEGVPKLLDFGVASIMLKTGSLAAAAILKTVPISVTPLAQPAGMTPAFAAPEQLRGEPVTTASDVYALGVLLHMLITDKHPFAADTSSHTELIRAVLSDDAALASESIASLSSKRWARGDLDSVIAKALEREPEDRYAAAGELAADLRRFLSQRPVLARSPSLSRRAALFARRHRLWTPVLLGLAMLALGAGLWVWKFH